MDIGKFEYCPSETMSSISDDNSSHFHPQHHHSTTTTARHHHHQHPQSQSASQQQQQRARVYDPSLHTIMASSAESAAAAGTGTSHHSSQQQHLNVKHGNSSTNSSASGAGHTNSSNDGGPNSFMAHYERNLNFATVNLDENEYGFPKKKTVRDPLSHRIIEKRRRDRMNNCLADLSRLLPQASLRKGRGRIEKTEIVELAIKHLQHLQTHPCPHGDNCEYSPFARKGVFVASSGTPGSSSSSPPIPQGGRVGAAATIPNDRNSDGNGNQLAVVAEENFQHGFQECISETMHFLIECKGIHPGDSLCVQLAKYLNERLNLKHNGIKKVSTDVSNASSGTSASSTPKIIPYYSIDLNKSRNIISAECVSLDERSNDGKEDHFNARKISNRAANNDMDSTFTGASRSCSPAPLNKNSTAPENIDMDNNSCSSSTHLSIVEDVPMSNNDSGNSTNGTMTNKNQNIPTIICTNSSSPPPHRDSPTSQLNNNSCNESCASADESSDGNHGYKFKTNIKQRFTANIHTPCKIKDADTGIEHLNPNNTQAYSEGAGGRNASPNPIRSNISSRNSNISEIEEHESNNNENEENRQPKNSSQPRVSQTTQQSGENCEDNENLRKTSSPQIPYVSVVKMSTLIESDDESAVTTIIPTTKPDKLIENIAKPCPMNLSREPQTQQCREKFQMKAPNSGSSGVQVPVFALSDEGQYYIPLTIDKSFLESVGGDSFEEMCLFQRSAKIPLYPVTISVCFAQKYKPICENRSLVSVAKELKQHMPVIRKDDCSTTPVLTKLRDTNLNISVTRKNTAPALTTFPTSSEVERIRKRPICETIPRSIVTNPSKYAKHQQQQLDAESDPEILIHQPAAYSAQLRAEESTLRKYLKATEQAHQSLSNSGRNSEENRGGETTVPFSTPSYLYPILLGACTPQTYSRMSSQPTASNTGNTDRSISRSYQQQQQQHTRTTPEVSSNCDVPIATRRRSNTNPQSMTSPPGLPSNQQPWKGGEYSRSPSYPATFHPESLRKIAVAHSDIISDNNSRSSSRNSSPGSSSTSNPCTNIRSRDYHLFLENQQLLWNNARDMENAQINGVYKCSADGKQFLVGKPYSSPSRFHSNTNRPSSPKRQKKDCQDDSYSIPKIITLK